MYFMISRSLGPEFGGGVGVLFVFANLAASALYIIGLVEALVAAFGPGGNLADSLPATQWWTFLYGSVVLFVCLIICMVGASAFAKTTFLIFCIVVISIISVIASFGAQKNMAVPVPENELTNLTTTPYTKPSVATFKGNLWPDFVQDYTTLKQLDFAAVFAVLFNGCTGFMAGANMSGDLANPSRAVPAGSLLSALFTILIYILVSTLVAFTCSRDMLHNNYGFLQDVNLWPPFVAIGTFAATLSAALSTLIGGSRVLQALARDKLFGSWMTPLVKGIRGSDEPHYSVLLCWLVVQCLLLTGEINVIAPLCSIFFLLSYAATNLACLALTLASAPNWRPTFKYCPWPVSLLGVVASVAMMFVVDAIYSLVCILCFIVLFAIVLIYSPDTGWGHISQALM